MVQQTKFLSWRRASNCNDENLQLLCRRVFGCLNDTSEDTYVKCLNQHFPCLRALAAHNEMVSLNNSTCLGSYACGSTSLHTSRTKTHSCIRCMIMQSTLRFVWCRGLEVYVMMSKLIVPRWTHSSLQKLYMPIAS